MRPLERPEPGPRDPENAEADDLGSGVTSRPMRVSAPCCRCSAVCASLSSHAPRRYKKRRASTHSSTIAPPPRQLILIPTSPPPTHTTMSAKVAIVTGAAQGIGRAIAVRLAADGFDVGVNDLPSAEQVEKLEELKAEIEKLGRKAIVVTGDVSQEAAVEKIVKDTVAAFGGLDVMVANAGTCELAPVVASECTHPNLSPEPAADPHAHQPPSSSGTRRRGVNLRGVFLCFKHAGQQMLAQGKERGGRLIGGASLGGFSGVPMGGAYSASKAGMRGLTHSAARELGPNGITVNSYAPGIVVTPLTLRNFGAEFLESQKPSCALGDHGTPEDIAALVSFLASKESRFITGQTIMIDGGRLCI
ncbi:hypothetical protein EVG20_g8433 [Dentipellis fragilis]|uniref:NAD(P)-binding protein n=1 Tax=Dentipellis fragilis TaxID=205917 RepID=A0A4Y9Y8G3_9AGAM|nr:hypothetical protein EVG20_g8433 [Dentipellis fragilis]